MEKVECKHEYTMQRFDLADEPSHDGGVGLDVRWCSDCGVLLSWHSQLTGKLHKGGILK